MRGPVESLLHAAEVHVGVEWGESIPDVGRAVQRRVREYLQRMAGLAPEAVEVVVDEVGWPL